MVNGWLRTGDLAERDEREAGGRDDDVGIEVLARLELDAGLGERLDVVGHDRSAALLDGLEPQMRPAVNPDE